MDGIRVIVQALRRFDRAAEKQAGLSGAQTFVLQKLRGARAISVNELAERTHTHQSSVSVVVGKLIERKLAARRQSTIDARQALISITPRGRKVLDTAPATSAQDRLIEALYRLPSGQCGQLADLLHRVASLAGAARKTPMLFFEDATGSASDTPDRQRRGSDSSNARH